MTTQQSADSCVVFLENVIAERGSTRGATNANTFMGEESTTDKQTPALTSPTNVFWCWFTPLLQLVFLKALTYVHLG